ncbi:MAG: bifunctional hydroxymethylpyrimidine kinase/phosphomethylpyrimidine kinase [Polyangiales bacterium]
MLPVALTIAGSDPSGGAGLQADLKTFHTHRVYGMAAITLLTVQNTRGVSAVQLVEPQLIADQICAVFADIPPLAIKTGAIGAAPQVEAVVSALSQHADVPLVVDPVCLSKTQAELLDSAGRAALMQRLLPRAALVTPNLDEARLLLGRALETPEEIAAAARELVDLGAGAALIKGGHRVGEPIDVLYTGSELIELRAERVPTQHTHGAGCTLAAAITSRLAEGRALPEACALAKLWVTRALASAPGLGGGQGPLNHWATLPE